MTHAENAGYISMAQSARKLCKNMEDWVKENSNKINFYGVDGALGSGINFDVSCRGNQVIVRGNFVMDGHLGPLIGVTNADIDYSKGSLALMALYKNAVENEFLTSEVLARHKCSVNGVESAFFKPKN